MLDDKKKAGLAGLAHYLEKTRKQLPPPPKPKKLKLGTLGKEDWLDLSDYLVHFARGEDGYKTMMSILSSGLVMRGPNPFGCASKHKGLDPETQRTVCFSEAPLGFLHRLVERRQTKFGIGFAKHFILKPRYGSRTGRDSIRRAGTSRRI